MQNKDKGDGIEDSPLDMLLVIILEGASKEVVTPSSWHQVDYSVKFVLFTLSRLNVKVGGLRVKFVQVYEWFDGCDTLKLIFKS